MTNSNNAKKVTYWAYQLEKTRHEDNFLTPLLKRSLLDGAESLEEMSKGFGITIAVGYEQLKWDNSSPIPYHVSVQPMSPIGNFISIWVKGGDYYWSREFGNLVEAKYWFIGCLLTYFMRPEDYSIKLEDSLKMAISMISNAENILKDRISYEIRNK